MHGSRSPTRSKNPSLRAGNSSAGAADYWRGIGGAHVGSDRAAPLFTHIPARRLAGATVAGVCTGVLVLSAAGLTKGRPCTTHHLGKADLAAQGGKVIDARVVEAS
ncbi:DJ-1/PfpI family protein [Streptomyces sp. NPDC005760]|uniref:DJ-1/PfpI family protein n=1 Tax=Streptomyces sp. NPDC005760 TaxID=3156718 RepID=UPI0033E25CDE